MKVSATIKHEGYKVTDEDAWKMETIAEDAETEYEIGQYNTNF